MQGLITENGRISSTPRTQQPGGLMLSVMTHLFGIHVDLDSAI